MKKLGWIFLLLFALQLVFSNVAINNFVLSSTTTKICVEPTVTTNYIGFIFSVDVNVTSVSNMWSWDFYLYYNNTLLNCTYAQSFPAASWTYYTQVAPTIEQDYNSTHGRVHATLSALGGSPFNGSMTISTIWFNVTVAAGSCTLDIKDSVIRDKNDVEISHEEHDGTFQTGKYTKVVFRFLGVETGCNENFRSAQYLIQNLTRFLNWQNKTWGKYNYTSYIHLLSNASNAQSLPYYVGQPKETNVKNEIQNFLGKTELGESNSLTIRIFYYNGHGGKTVTASRKTWYLKLWKYRNPQAPSGYAWECLDDSELNQSLNSGDLRSSNCVAVVLDTCYAGGFINNVSKTGRVILAASKESETSWRWTGSSPPPGYWAIFTGNEKAKYPNGTFFGSLGIIGGLFSANDTNFDRWRSANEIFDFANETTIKYQKGGGYSIFHPQRYYGVINGRIPFVMQSKYILCRGIWPWGETIKLPTPFPYNPSGLRGRSRGRLNSWRMLGNSPSRESHSPSEGPVQPDLLWNKAFNSPITSSTAISDKVVFLASENGTLYAIEIETKETIWSFDSGTSVESSPAVVDGMVFFGTDSGKVYALDEGTGLVRWVYNIPSGASIASSPVVSNRTVFIGSSDNHLYALDEISGFQIWNFSTTGPIVSSPAVSNDMVFVGSNDGRVYALNMTDGALEWDYPTYSPIVSSPTVCEPIVYVTSMNGRVYALDQFSGNYLQDFPTGGSITSSPAVDENQNLVIVGSQDEFVYALDRITLTLEWSTHIGMINISSPAISGNGLVYIGSTNNLFCLNETSGEVVWSYPTSSVIHASPALTDEHVLVSSYDGILYCFGPEFPYHDVTVSSLKIDQTIVERGQTVIINYNITNLGNRIEIFNIIIAYNTTEIWTSPLYLEPEYIHTKEIMLEPNQSIKLTFRWDTTGKTPGKYSILVIIPSLEYESNTSNNVYRSQVITIEAPTIRSGGGGSKMLLLK